MKISLHPEAAAIENLAMASMHNPPLRGETLRADVLPELGLTVSEAARQLGVSRVQLSRAAGADKRY